MKNLSGTPIDSTKPAREPPDTENNR